MLTLLEQGAEYLSDDRLFVDLNGYCYTFPTPLRLFQYNLRAFPGLSKGKASSIRSELSYRMSNTTKDMSKDNFLRSLLDFTNNSFVKQKITLPPSELHSEVSHSEKYKVDYAMYLETTRNQHKALTLNSYPSKHASQTLVSISNHEWNLPIERIYSAYDLLFPERRSKTQMLRKLRKREQTIFENFIDSTDFHLIPVPEEAQWPDDTKRSLYRLISNLN